MQVVDSLLAVQGLKVNKRTPEGWTALVAAADKGHHLIVKKLLKHPDTDPNIRDRQGILTSISGINKVY